MPPLSCRFYEHRFPEIEDVVMVTVLSVAEMGAYVFLLEYNKIEGMILLSELSRRRIRSINKLIRIGRDECVVVIRVDKDKGYIDLSKRRVSPEEVIKCEEKFAKAKCVNSILTHVAQLLKYESDAQLEDLYQKTAWYFDRKFGKPGASYEAFKHAVTNPEVLAECEIDEETRNVLLANIKRRLTPHAVKIRAVSFTPMLINITRVSGRMFLKTRTEKEMKLVNKNSDVVSASYVRDNEDLEVACYGYEGVDAVKDSLRAGLNMSTQDMPIKINLIAPPLYVMTTQTLERSEGIQKLTEALEKIKEIIEQSGGVFTIKMPPKVVSDMDELELAKQLERLEEQNREVSGDEGSDSGPEDEEEENKEKENVEDVNGEPDEDDIFTRQ